MRVDAKFLTHMDAPLYANEIVARTYYAFLGP